VYDPRAYVQVARMLREQISDGQLKTGSCLPSIGQICKETGRSRHTVGKALRLLKDEGFVMRVAGYPYYVRALPDSSSCGL
jgi:DNA-binding GntR family transcriptional regulator